MAEMHDVDLLLEVVSARTGENDLLLRLLRDLVAAQHAMLDRMLSQQAELDDLRERIENRPGEAGRALRAQSQQAQRHAAHLQRRSELLSADAALLLSGSTAPAT